MTNNSDRQNISFFNSPEMTSLTTPKRAFDELRSGFAEASRLFHVWIPASARQVEPLSLPPEIRFWGRLVPLRTGFELPTGICQRRRSLTGLEQSAGNERRNWTGGKILRFFLEKC